MYRALESIQLFVAPVVMISANGLLCLAFYNRMSSLANRSRTMNKERFDLITRLSALHSQGRALAEGAHLSKRIEALHELGHQLFQRARWIRGTLLSLLLSVLAMLACSLALGLSSFGTALAGVALLFFVIGAVAMMCGVLMAIQELRLALDPLLFEHEQIGPWPETPTVGSNSGDDLHD